MLPSSWNSKLYKVAHEAKFLSENVVLYSLEKKPRYIFVFARSQRAVVKAVASLQQRLTTTPSEPIAEPAAKIEETLATA